MNALWWLALPILLLPVWWHRRKRVQNKAAPMATARFLPRTEPRQTRIWRWRDPLLLLVRCLLLALLIAWLADPVYPYRGDTVVVTQGADAAWVEREVTQARLANAERVTLPAAKPAFGRPVEVRSQAAAPVKVERHVYIASERAAEWRRMFAAQVGPETIVIEDTPGAATTLIVWDSAEAPPAALRASLWWVTQPSAFPELAKSRAVNGLRYADSARGRLWHHADWPPRDPEAARALLDDWQQLHIAPRPYTMSSQAFAADQDANAPAPGGALRGILLAILAALFVLERTLTHARRR